MAIQNDLVARTFASEREAYERDGAILIRRVVDPVWINRMREAISDIAREQPGLTLWMSRAHAEFSAFATHSALAELAGQLMRADRVRFFYDQLFVKSAMSDNPTPLHQDLPYWPIEGNQIISIWVPFDRVTRENSVVQYIRGSHQWGRMFEPVPFTREGVSRANKVGSSGYEEIHDPAALVAESHVLSWELNPGDVLVHHPLALHFASPNVTRNEHRRAIALRYVGADAQFVDRAGNFMRQPEPPAHWPKAPIVTGAPIEGSDYPLVWQA